MESGKRVSFFHSISFYFGRWAGADEFLPLFLLLDGYHQSRLRLIRSPRNAREDLRRVQFRYLWWTLYHLWISGWGLCLLYLPLPPRTIRSHVDLSLSSSRLGISDAYYCAECTRLEKDRDGCPKIVNLGASRTDLFYERRRLGAFVLLLFVRMSDRLTDCLFQASRRVSLRH